MLNTRDKWLLHHTFKLLRESVEELEYQQDIMEPTIEPAEELHVFDFDNTLAVCNGEFHEIHKYKKLPNIELLREKSKAGYPCYICTARFDQENVGYIQAFLENNQIKLPVENIQVVGRKSKGDAVSHLLTKHNPEQAWFYDDKEKNVNAVFETCKDIAKELHIVKMSTAVLGEIIEETVCGTQTKTHKKSHRIIERGIFRTWHRLGGI